MLDNPRSDRVRSVRALGTRSGRRRSGHYLVEGPQGVREVIAFAAPLVREVFLTTQAADRYPEIAAADDAGVPVRIATPEVLDAMSPDAQGVLAVVKTENPSLKDVLSGIAVGRVRVNPVGPTPTIRYANRLGPRDRVPSPRNEETVYRDHDTSVGRVRAQRVYRDHGEVDASGEAEAAAPVVEPVETTGLNGARRISANGQPAESLTGSRPVGTPRLIAVLNNARDPGNVGTVIRAADAAGADAVVLAGECVELQNPKLVRSTAGSLFHLPVVTDISLPDVVARLRAAGLRILAADGAGDLELFDDADAAAPTAWIFGNEAWGLTDADRALADQVVRVPLYGAAESLNLAMAATICLYTTARAQHG